VKWRQSSKSATENKKANSDYSIITSAICITFKTHTVIPTLVIIDSCWLSMGMVGGPGAGSSCVYHSCSVVLAVWPLPDVCVCVWCFARSIS